MSAYRRLPQARRHGMVLRSHVTRDAVILRLPVETMSAIFRMVQTQNNFDRLFHTSQSSSIIRWHWITVSHVCKHWRDIALTTSVLWSVIKTWLFAHLEHVEAYLERSNGSPLVVHHFRCGATNIYSEVLCLTLQHLGRTRSLDLTDPVKDNAEAFISGLNRPAPILEECSITSPSLELHRAFDLKHFFSGQCPKLKNLTLAVPVYSWLDIPNLGNLTSLIFGHHATPPSLGDVFTILETNSNIAVLYIYYLKKIEVDDEIPSIRQPIQLPALTEFISSAADYAALSRLLRNLILPRNTLRFEVSCTSYPLHNIDPYANIIFSTMNTMKYCVSLRILVENARLRIIPRIKFPEQQSVLYDWSNTVLLPRTPAKALELVCFLLRNSSWSTATKVYLFIQKNNSLDTPELELEAPLHELLRLLPSVKKMSVTYVRPRMTYDGLLFSVEHSFEEILRVLYSTSGSELICPKLEELSLCRFEHRNGLETLNEMLVFREMEGARVRHLKVAGMTEDEFNSKLKDSGLQADEITYLQMDNYDLNNMSYL